jgi:hypothetical protein
MAGRGVSVVDLRSEDRERVREVAEVLVEGFRGQAPDAWPDLETALGRCVNRSAAAGRAGSRWTKTAR